MLPLGQVAAFVEMGSKPEFAAFSSNGCCLPPKYYADLPRRSNYNTTSSADRRGIIRSSALWILCRHRHKTHWTGATKRLDRLGRFNDRKAYAFEELVAEIGNCMLCAQIGVEPEFDQSAAYVEGWLEAMKEDSRAIFRAASEAQKAVDYIMDRTAQAEQMAAE